jgi:hypothetical protein
MNGFCVKSLSVYFQRVIKAIVSQNIFLGGNKMKRSLTTLFVVLVIGLAFSFNLMAQSVQNDDTGETFTTLKQAIDDDNTEDGHTLIVTGTLTEHSIEVSKDLTIRGSTDSPLDTIVRASAQAKDPYAGRVFSIVATVTIENITIKNGYFKEMIAQGGGIYVTGDLTLNKCIVQNNIAEGQGSIPGIGNGYGGGLATNEGASIVLNNCAIVGNEAKAASQASGGGLVLRNSSDSITMTNCTVFDNSAKSGGGIYLLVGNLTLNSCTIAGNTATGDDGPGVHLQNGFLTIRNTIIADNGDKDLTADAQNITDNGYNIVESVDSTQTSDQFTVSNSEFIGTTQDNNFANLYLDSDYSTEGNTYVVKIVDEDSIAINNGYPNASETDQAGQDRVCRPDIGAYEYQFPGGIPNELRASILSTEPLETDTVDFTYTNMEVTFSTTMDQASLDAACFGRYYAPDDNGAPQLPWQEELAALTMPGAKATLGWYKSWASNEFRVNYYDNDELVTDPNAPVEKITISTPSTEYEDSGHLEIPGILPESWYRFVIGSDEGCSLPDDVGSEGCPLSENKVEWKFKTAKLAGTWDWENPPAPTDVVTLSRIKEIYDAGGGLGPVVPGTWKTVQAGTPPVDIQALVLEEGTYVMTQGVTIDAGYGVCVPTGTTVLVGNNGIRVFVESGGYLRTGAECDALLEKSVNVLQDGNKAIFGRGERLKAGAGTDPGSPSDQWDGIYFEQGSYAYFEDFVIEGSENGLVDVENATNPDDPEEPVIGPGVTLEPSYFTFDPEVIDDQTVNVPFTITLTMKDKNGNTITGFTDMVNLTDTTGTIDPASVNFDDGIEDGQATVGVTISVVQTDVQITASYDYDGTLIESSTNAFDVKVGTQVEIPSDGPWPFEFTFANGVSITVPDGAIDFGGETSTTLTCNTVDTGLPDTLGGITETVLAAEFSFDPVVTLTDAVTVCYPYDEGALQTETLEESLRLHEVDVDKWTFIVGSYVDMDNDKVCADVTALSTIGVLGGYPYGDVNADGSLTITDAGDMLSDFVGIERIFDGEDNAFANAVADVDYDPTASGYDPGDEETWPERPTITDVGDVLSRFVEIISEFKVEANWRGYFSGSAPSITNVLPENTVLRHASLDYGRDMAIKVVLDEYTDVFGADIMMSYNSSLMTVGNVFTEDRLLAYNDSKINQLRIAVVNMPLTDNENPLADVQFVLNPGADKTEALDSIKLTKVEINDGLVPVNLENRIPKELELLQNYPNPFNPETWIPYELDKASDVEIRIYNVNGEMIRNITLGQQSPGYYVTRDKAAYWNGLNKYGERVSSGIYFYQVLAGSKESQIKKMVILK